MAGKVKEEAENPEAVIFINFGALVRIGYCRNGKVGMLNFASSGVVARFSTSAVPRNDYLAYCIR